MKPSIAIVVRGGVVQSVVSATEHTFYRIIDQDDEQKHDLRTDDEFVDIEKYTKEELG